MPAEWQLSLYSDETIRPICEHAEIQPVMKNCEVRLSFVFIRIFV